MNNLEDEVRRKVKALQHDADALEQYLFSFAKYDSTAANYHELYSSLLDNPDWYLRKVAWYALLFTFRLQDPIYTAKALLVAQDEQEDFEVRLWACAGLGRAYENSFDLSLMVALIQLFEKDKDDLLIRVNALQSFLLIYGVPRATMYAIKVEDEEAFNATVRRFDNEIRQVRLAIG